MAATPRGLFTSLCLLTGQTEHAAHRLGARFFLPQLFTLRYCSLGGLDPATFARQIDELRSFDERRWCAHWNGLAEQELAEGRMAEAMTYYTVSAFPGTTPRRLAAYRKARELLDELMPAVDDRAEKVVLDLAGERVEGYVRFPEGDTPGPFVIATNGLEGTIQEIMLPLARYRDRSSLGIFVMEMPGTYAYERPMTTNAPAIYDAVIEHFAADPRVDAERIGFFGISFGGYWAARMAATNRRLACAVACGAPADHTFGPTGGVGVPRIVVDALMKVTGTRHLPGLTHALRRLSLGKADLYRQITIPLLVINGANDTLVSTKDSIDLALKAPGGLLKLYEGDDHCAMAHLDDWLGLSVAWLEHQLDPRVAGLSHASAAPG